MARRTSPSELPIALAVERYSKCERFTLAQWASALLARFLCKNAIDKEYPKSAKDRLSAIMEDPTADADMRTLVTWLALKPTLRGPAVLDLRWRDAESIARILIEEGEAQYSGFTDKERAEEEQKRERRNQLRRAPSPDSSFQDAWTSAEGGRPSTNRLMIVKLDATNEQIRSDFEEWLKRARATQGVEDEAPPSVPSFSHATTPVDWQTLHQSRVLTYIDLALWAEINDRAISAQVYAFALFGDRSRTHTIRDTVQPKARALLTESSIRPLIAQAQATL